MILSQIVLLPLLLLFTWGYLALRPASRRRRSLACYDAAVIIVAFLASGAAVWLFNNVYGDPANSIWRVVLSTVTTFHTYPAVLLAGWYLRRRIFTAE